LLKEGEKMKRKIAGICIVILLLSAAINPLTVKAVSYPPASLYHHEYTAETVMKAGEIVHLFESGTDDVKQAIHPNDILTVYRVNPTCEVKVVGKIKVISYVGDTYLKGEIIEGEIKPDDIAKKGTISCLVISAGLCSH
jgi:hypothetical protein